MKLKIKKHRSLFNFIFGLFLATIIMLPLGLLMGRYAYKSIIKIPKEILIPIIIFLTIIGSYSIQNNILNVYFMFFFGLIGWILNRAGFKACLLYTSPSPRD